jgi:hypothetical protein
MPAHPIIGPGQHARTHGLSAQDLGPTQAELDRTDRLRLAWRTLHRGRLSPLVAERIDRAVHLVIRVARAQQTILESLARYHLARALSLRVRFYEPDLKRLLILVHELKSLPGGILDPDHFDLSGLRTDTGTPQYPNELIRPLPEFREGTID